MVSPMRLPALLLPALLLPALVAALPAEAAPPDRAAEVARWFRHCAAWSSPDDVVETLATTACLDRAFQMCRTVETIAPGSGCLDRLEAQAREEEAALVPALQAIRPATAFGRQAIERELQRLSEPPQPRPCPDTIAAGECPAFGAIMDWIDLRSVIFIRSPK